MVVLGAGAAGLYCAAVAARRGRGVVVLEHMDEPGRKILVSGGGRCNFTNLDADAENYLSSNPHFAKSALSRHPPQEFVDLVERHRIPYHEKNPGQLFCDGQAREIRQMLVEECRNARVETFCRAKVNAVATSMREGEGKFRVLANIGEFACDSLVVATGGLSFPKLGASDLGYRIAAQFGLEIVAPEPALVPFVWNQEDMERFGDLSGVSVEALVSCRGVSFRENILFTHRGLSGPAVLQISSYWHETGRVLVNLLPGMDLAAWLKDERQKGNRSELKNALAGFLPRRVADRFAALFCPAKTLPNLSDREAARVASVFQEWTFVPAGTEGFGKAEVTRGGVSTDELSSKTMESRKVPGLYFIGEVVDVTGWLGGYNFQWAWSSAHAAGEVA